MPITATQHATTAEAVSQGPDLLCRAVRDVSALPKAVHANLLELGCWRVGVEALPGVKNHFAGG